MEKVGCEEDKGEGDEEGKREVRLRVGQNITSFQRRCNFIHSSLGCTTPKATTKETEKEGVEKRRRMLMWACVRDVGGANSCVIGYSRRYADDEPMGRRRRSRRRWR